MASLEALIPEIAAYQQAQNQGQRRQMGQLQQMGALQEILARQQQAQAQQAGMQEQAQMQGVLQQAGGNPEAVIQRLMASGNPKAIELATKIKSAYKDRFSPAGDGILNTGTGDVAPNPYVKESAPKPPAMRTRTVGETQVQEEYQPDGTWREVGRGPRFAKQVAGQGGGGTAFGATQGSLDAVKDKETIRNLATESLYDSNALSGFRRDTRAMGNIMRERTNLMKEAGITAEDVVSGRAGFKADTASLNKITPQYDAITAFEKTAIRNGKILIELADKVDTTGLPVAERWIRAGRKAIGGDPDVARFDAQMNLYRAEAARILTQPNLSGVLTDTARKEMEEVIRNSATAPQIRGVVNLLERDFLNRKETLEEQIGAIRTRMSQRVGPGGGGGVAPAQPAAAPASPQAPAAPAAQRVTATGPNGQKLELVNGQWQPVRQ